MDNTNHTDNTEHKHSKFDLSVSVLNSEENWFQLPGFNITVAKTLSIILDKLKLPRITENDQRIKYYLYRTSNVSEDGYEILAENDKSGNPVLLEEYGIHNGIRLFVGALTLPSINTEIDFEASGTTNFEDDEIIEI